MSIAQGSSRVAARPPRGTYLGVAPVSLICFKYRSKKGSKRTISSAGWRNRVNARYKACDAPTVMATSFIGSMARFKCFEYRPASNSTSGGWPAGRVYWWYGDVTACCSDSSRNCGGDQSGNPWPKFVAPVLAANSPNTVHTLGGAAGGVYTVAAAAGGAGVATGVARHGIGSVPSVASSHSVASAGFGAQDKAVQRLRAWNSRSVPPWLHANTSANTIAPRVIPGTVVGKVTHRSQKRTRNLSVAKSQSVTVGSRSKGAPKSVDGEGRSKINRIGCKRLIG